MTLRTLADQVQTEADAYAFLEDLRWHGNPVCAHCGHDKAYFLTPKNGTTRATGPNRTMSPRRVWKCAKCRRQFSVLTNSIFHGTKDWVVPIEQSRELAVKLKDYKAPVKLVEVAGEGHGWEGKANAETTRETLRFLNERLNK